MSLTVSSLVKYLKNKLDSDDNIQNITVTGELSNFHRHTSGHLYFTLKDDKSSISCVMFSSKSFSLKFEPKNGDKVKLNANTSLFEVSGQLQLYVNSMILDGLGDLYVKYEELKNKLSELGMFDISHKKQMLTKYPEKIGVIVGENSAAMSDIKICFKRRWPLCSVEYFPSLVQGAEAPKDIIKNLKMADSKNYDAIILARGGGSFEDLFCFNDEELANVIYNLKTFIISGIGHEQDFTIADFVSDLRAPTPTAAVELITPNIFDIKNDINKMIIDLHTSMSYILNNNKNKLSLLLKNKYLLDPLKIISNYSLKLDYYISNINNYSTKIKNIKNEIRIREEKIINNLNNKIIITNEKLNNYKSLLKAYSYENTLSRGYSIVYKDGQIIKDVNNLEINDDINIKLFKGDIKTIIKEKNNG